MWHDGCTAAVMSCMLMLGADLGAVLCMHAPMQCEGARAVTCSDAGRVAARRAKLDVLTEQIHGNLRALEEEYTRS